MTAFDEIKAHAVEDNTVPINDSHELSDRLTRCLNDRAALIAMVEHFQWRPIAEAPRDGTRIIYLDKVGGERGLKMKNPWWVGDCVWRDSDENIAQGWWDESGTLYAEPLYWMPLPSPPSDGGG